MAILSKVNDPLSAEHLEVVIRNFHETYSYEGILFETVVPIPGKNDLYRFIVVYDDRVQNEISAKEVNANDTRRNSKAIKKTNKESK